MPVSKKDVKLNEHYLKNVSGNRTIVKILRTCGNGWVGLNIKTNREVQILSGRGLRHIPEKDLESMKQIYKI